MRKGSLEIGVNMIVILVIAMMLLGLGIGFVKGLFGKANTLPELIDTESWENPPTPSEPIRITPSSIELKRGKSKDVKVGIYNAESSKLEFSISIEKCIGPDGTEAVPKVQALSATIPPGESKGFKAIVTAVAGDGNIAPGKYICKLVGAVDDDSVSYDAQFIMTVTS